MTKALLVGKQSRALKQVAEMWRRTSLYWWRNFRAERGENTIPSDPGDREVLAGLDALQAERDAAVKDAKRWRWFVNHAQRTYRNGSTATVFFDSESPIELDKAVDAALAAERTPHA